MYIFIKKVLVSMYGKDTAEKIKIIYGGSVEPSNVSGLTESGVDGFLVGHASLKASYFNDILKNIDEI
jgi:triosephosphate isomerase